MEQVRRQQQVPLPRTSSERDDDLDSDFVPPAPQPLLSERDQQILAFEKQWWKHAGAKEQAIREQFDLSATRYYQVLNALLDDPLALAYDPIVVGRLRRLRGSRSRARGSR